MNRLKSITKLVDNTDITIIPTINPDGFDRSEEGECSGKKKKLYKYQLPDSQPGENFKSGRLNDDKKDINRDFPTWKDIKKSRKEIYTNRQPETKVVKCFV